MPLEPSEDKHYLRVAAVVVVFARNNVNPRQRFGVKAFFGNRATLLKRVERFKGTVFH